MQDSTSTANLNKSIIYSGGLHSTIVAKQFDFIFVDGSAFNFGQDSRVASESRSD